MERVDLGLEFEPRIRLMQQTKFIVTLVSGATSAVLDAAPHVKGMPFGVSCSFPEGTVVCAVWRRRPL